MKNGNRYLAASCARAGLNVIRAAMIAAGLAMLYGFVAMVCPAARISSGTSSVAAGAPGAAGSAGVGITNTTVNGSNHLIVFYSNGTSNDVGSVLGPTGAAGRGISVVATNGIGHLMVTYSDGSSNDVGNVVGATGATGATGADGSLNAIPDIAKATPLSVTWSGFLPPLPLAYMQQVSFVPGGFGTNTTQTASPTNVVGIVGGWTLTGDFQTNNMSLTSISFDNLGFCGGGLAFNNMGALTSYSATNLLYCLGTLSFSMDASLTNVSMPKLMVLGGLTVGSGALSLPVLPVLQFNAVVYMGNVQVNQTGSGIPLLASFEMSSMVNQAGSFNLGQGSQPLTSLTNLNLTAFAHSTSDFLIQNLPALAQVNLPSFASLGGSFTINTLNACTNLYAPVLESVEGSPGISLTIMQSLGVLSLPSLSLNYGNIVINGMTNLVSVSIPNIVTNNGAVTINSGLGHITNCVFGTSNVTLYVNGNFNIASQQLTRASIDGLLHVFASLSGSNGTTAWGAGKTLRLSGGTNATPSAAGTNDMTTITSRGATVLTN